MRHKSVLLATLLPVMWAYSALGQAAVRAASAVPAPPPATRLEAFKPAAGSVVTFGYNQLGKLGGISVDARELRDSKGGVVRGVVIEVTQDEYREERAFIDADELPELISGIDALLAVKTNPTRFQNFEVRYTTKGELQLTAFNSGSEIRYAVQTGRTLHAQVFVDEDTIRKLQSMFQKAQQQLSTSPERP